MCPPRSCPPYLLLPCLLRCILVLIYTYLVPLMGVAPMTCLAILGASAARGKEKKLEAADILEVYASPIKQKKRLKNPAQALGKPYGEPTNYTSTYHTSRK